MFFLICYVHTKAIEVDLRLPCRTDLRCFTQLISPVFQSAERSSQKSKSRPFNSR